MNLEALNDALSVTSYRLVNTSKGLFLSTVKGTVIGFSLNDLTEAELAEYVEQLIEDVKSCQ